MFIVEEQASHITINKLSNLKVVARGTIVLTGLVYLSA